MKFLILIVSLISLNTFAQNDKFCKKITKTIDDFTGQVTYSSPFTVGQYPELITVSKTIVKDSTLYYMTLNAYGSTASVGEKGVIILLDDGSKLEFPTAEINASVYSANIYQYTSNVRLSLNQIKKLSETTIDKYRLHIYDKEIKKSKNKIKYQEYTKCIESISN